MMTQQVAWLGFCITVMAPLGDALQVRIEERRTDGTCIYRGVVDKEWCIGAIPQGGYAIGLALQACTVRQAETDHKDPVHLTSHFLRSMIVGSFQVLVTVIRIGQSFTNLRANVVQKDEVRLQTHMIFGTLPDVTQLAPSKLTIVPPSGYARRIPLLVHPAHTAITGTSGPTLAKFMSRIKFGEDQAIREATRAQGRITASSPGHLFVGGEIEWGAWVEIIGETNQATETMMPFFMDQAKSAPSLLPKELRSGPSWHPTVTMSVQFTSKIPRDSAFSPSTFGLYSTSRFMHQGRHDAYAEIWTAPSTIGETRHDNNDETWREKMVCLAFSHQMALTLPVSVNIRRGEAKL